MLKRASQRPLYLRPKPVSAKVRGPRVAVLRNSTTTRPQCAPTGPELTQLLGAGRRAHEEDVTSSFPKSMCRSICTPLHDVCR